MMTKEPNIFYSLLKKSKNNVYYNFYSLQFYSILTNMYGERDFSKKSYENQEHNGFEHTNGTFLSTAPCSMKLPSIF